MKNYRLAVDENGSPFVLNSKGSIDFGYITEEMNLPAAPIRVAEGDESYGLAHMEKNHSDQLSDVQILFFNKTIKLNSSLSGERLKYYLQSKVDEVEDGVQICDVNQPKEVHTEKKSADTDLIRIIVSVILLATGFMTSGNMSVSLVLFALCYLVCGYDILLRAVRNIRKQKNLPQKEALELKVVRDENYPSEFEAAIAKMANLSAVTFVTEKNPMDAAFIVKTTQYFVPMEGKIDREAEVEKLTAELSYYEGFLQSVMKKLSNERFVQSAPEKVVANERAKQSDAEAKIAAIKERIEALK